MTTKKLRGGYEIIFVLALYLSPDSFPVMLFISQVREVVDNDNLLKPNDHAGFIQWIAGVAGSLRALRTYQRVWVKTYFAETVHHR